MLTQARTLLERAPYWFWLALIGIAFVLGYRASPSTTLYSTPADMEFQDWHVRVHANQYGLYINNLGDTALTCKLLPGHITIQPGYGFWLSGKPGPFFECTPKE
jgi:hypothetical protein